MKLDFLRRQVLMSRNIRGGVLTDFALGGLNYQIEHHLFPSMRADPQGGPADRSQYCAVHGIAYTEVGLFASYRIVVDYLNNVGLSAGSVRLPAGGAVADHQPAGGISPEPRIVNLTGTRTVGPAGAAPGGARSSAGSPYGPSRRPTGRPR